MHRDGAAARAVQRTLQPCTFPVTEGSRFQLACLFASQESKRCRKRNYRMTTRQPKVSQRKSRFVWHTNQAARRPGAARRSANRRPASAVWRNRESKPPYSRAGNPPARCGDGGQGFHLSLQLIAQVLDHRKLVVQVLRHTRHIEHPRQDQSPQSQSE